MHSDSARYSNAGDRFHYLWAARRCLRLIDPGSPVEQITMEDSPEPDGEGEYVIDVSEVVADVNGSKSVNHFQLKHSSARTDQVIVLSELEKTLAGFAARFRGETSFAEQSFHVVSNREVSDRVKTAVALAGTHGALPSEDLSALERVTKLKGGKLRNFCARLSFMDSQGDYRAQERELRSEVSRYVAGSLEDSEMMKLKALVEDHALPHVPGARTRGRILREHVLARLGYTDPRELFPAQLAMESIEGMFRREQHSELVRQIFETPSPLIIRAAGGVGKSVVARQLADSFAPGSVGVVYDCFGGGNYLNASQPRHRPCDALVQLANELAVKGLCRTLIAPSSKPVEVVLRDFLRRLDEACFVIGERDANALLVLLIDAADNAEMAAEQQNERCFASMLARENYPSNCRVVLLCRPEREDMLKPKSTTVRLDLLPFSPAETLRHMQSRFPAADENDGKEFHRLTGGNPRVQANCLTGKQRSLRAMLNSIAAVGLTVDEQIATQLNKAIASLIDQHPDVFKKQTEAICQGLATLPPFIPIPVLAAAAGVREDAIKSLVADLGRPLWQSDEAVQFRDEPTETWFRQNYAASPEQLKSYAESLQSLASRYAYVARALPALWHRAGEHDRLITLALSDDFLPTDSPIDATDIRVYRLQYAFKAALQSKRLVDAAKLAFRTGEEMAGNGRKLSLLENNIDMMGALQDAHRIQECAYKRQIEGGWKGSANVFSASLLSMHQDFHGDARSYLHAAHRFLHLYFEEREKLKVENPHSQDALRILDVAELGWAHLRLEGAKGFASYISTWSPPWVVFEVTGLIVRRLVDAGRMEEAEHIALAGRKHPHLIVALSHELNEAGLFPPNSALEGALAVLASGQTEIKKDDNGSFDDLIPLAIVSFAEACAHHGLSSSKICNVLDRYATTLPSLYSIYSDYDPAPRHVFCRALALKSVLNGSPISEITALIPDAEQPKKESSHTIEERNDARKVLSVLVPLYAARAKLIVRKPDLDEIRLLLKGQRFNPPGGAHASRTNIDAFWDELPQVCLGILAMMSKVESEDLVEIEKAVQSKATLWRSLSRRISMVRLAYCHPHLANFGRTAEKATSALIREANSSDPDERATWWMGIARAVLAVSKSDAAAYFDEAIEAVSRFGDEMLARWAAVVATARHGGEAGIESPALAYRFVRCAEMIGNNVAREKHWDREDVFRVVAHLHAPSAFAALNRWRDRDVGWFGRQVEAVAITCVSSGIIPAAAGFCLTGFEGAHASMSILCECLDQEASAKRRNVMFEQAVEDIYRAGSLIKLERQLTTLAAAKKVGQEQLLELLERSRRRQSRVEINQHENRGFDDKAAEKTEDLVGPLLIGLDLTSIAGLSQAVATLNSMKPYRQIDAFWAAVIQRITHGSEVGFMKAILQVEALDSYDVRSFICTARLEWLHKAAVKRQWPLFLSEIGQRFHADLARWGSLEYWRETCGLDTEEVQNLTNGVHRGIQTAPSLLDCETLFGFVTGTMRGLSPAEAREVLDYALGRFELHIAPEFADGEWQPWLNPPHMPDAFTGFLWASLGDPDSATRWEAGHCVRRMVKLGCVDELESLIGWTRRAGVEAFVGKGFPFYTLHARLHLILGLACSAVAHAHILSAFAPTLANLAFEFPPHALIQTEAAKLTLTIESAVPGSVSQDVADRLRLVGVSAYEPRVTQRDELVDTPWHLEERSRSYAGPRFGMDFVAYWLPDLAGVFGISLDQLSDLMREAAVEYLGIADSDDYPEDPRRAIWNTRDYRSRDTYHHHGNYPKVDDFHFYYSYHAFMIVAAKLLAAMPVITQRSQYEDQEIEPNRWLDWIKHHQIMRDDGKWIADRRDPTLPARVASDSYGGSGDWQWNLKAVDFYNVMTAQAPLHGSVCVGGHWSDAEGGRKEDVSISTVFIRRETINSLAQALRQDDQPNLRYVNSRNHHNLAPEPFDLLHWIDEGESPGWRLDSADPHARSLDYPPQKLAPFICKQFHLTTDNEMRFWWRAAEKVPVAVSEAWSAAPMEKGDDYYRYGKRIFVSVPFLRNLCEELGRDLVFVVKIRRDVHHRQRYDDEGMGYLPSSHKTFIFSTDGILRDSTENYQLG